MDFSLVFWFFLVPYLCSIPLVLITVFLLNKTNIIDLKDKSITDIHSLDKSISQRLALSKNKTLFLAGCGFLIVSLLCIIALPFTFIFTLGAGMSGDFGEFVTISIIIGFLLNIAIAMASGIIGVIVLSIWAIKKHKTGLT